MKSTSNYSHSLKRDSSQRRRCHTKYSRLQYMILIFRMHKLYRYSRRHNRYFLPHNCLSKVLLKILVLLVILTRVLNISILPSLSSPRMKRRAWRSRKKFSKLCPKRYRHRQLVPKLSKQKILLIICLLGQRSTKLLSLHL